MTVKELSNFTGKTERTVRRWVAKAGDKVSQAPYDKMSQGIPYDYTIGEVESILNESSMSKDAVSIIMENARRSAPHSVEVAVYGESPVLAFMAQMQKQQQDFMTAVLDRLNGITPISEKQKALAAPDQDFRSMLNQIVRKYAKFHTNGMVSEAWGVLYEELYYRCHVSIRQRASNSGRSKIEEIERADLLESSYLIMIEKMGESA